MVFTSWGLWFFVQLRSVIIGLLSKPKALGPKLRACSDVASCDLALESCIEKLPKFR
jgi:hypothetical protein